MAPGVRNGAARPRLILVDDSPDNLDAFSSILADEFDVSAHTSPTDAVKAVSAVRPDVLVLDIAMGPIDGVQCLEAIRAIPGFSHVPAVALTGYGLDADRRA